MRGEAVAAAVLALSAAASTPAAADEDACWEPAWRCDTVNTYRAGHDRAPLDQRAALQDEATAWARHMAATGILRHSTIDYGGEIIGYAPDWATVMAAWDQSPAHRELLLDRDFTRVGIGRVRDAEGRIWCVVRFR